MNYINENLEIKNFVFADTDGNLKVTLKNLINRKSVFLFRNINDINKMTIDFGCKRPREETDESNDFE